MPQKTGILVVLLSLLLAPAAFAAPPGTTPAGMAGYGPGAGANPAMMRGACMGIMRTLTPEQHAMHFHDKQIKMDTLTVTKFRAWRLDLCTKLQAPAFRADYAKELQARWDKLSDKEKLALYHDMLVKRAQMGPRHGMRGKGRGMGRGTGWK